MRYWHIRWQDKYFISNVTHCITVANTGAAFGIAICSKRDKFNKKTGREIATIRALAAKEHLPTYGNLVLMVAPEISRNDSAQIIAMEGAIRLLISQVGYNFALITEFQKTRDEVRNYLRQKLADKLAKNIDYQEDTKQRAQYYRKEHERKMLNGK